MVSNTVKQVSFIHRTLDFRYLKQTRKVPIQTRNTTDNLFPLISRLGSLWFRWSGTNPFSGGTALLFWSDNILTASNFEIF